MIYDSIDIVVSHYNNWPMKCPPLASSFTWSPPSLATTTSHLSFITLSTSNYHINSSMSMSFPFIIMLCNIQQQMTTFGNKITCKFDLIINSQNIFNVPFSCFQQPKHKKVVYYTQCFQNGMLKPLFVYEAPLTMVAMGNF